VICWKGLVGHRRPRVLLAPVALGRVLAVVAVHLVQPLGLRVPGLEVVVGERPGRGEAVGVMELAEVLGSQTVERGAVQLRRAAHVVVDLGLEGRPVGVVPGVGRDVLAVDEHRARVPVVHLPGQEVAALEEQDLLSRRGEGVRKRAATRARPDDDHVVVVRHRSLPSEARPRPPGTRAQLSADPSASASLLGASGRRSPFRHGPFTRAPTLRPDRANGPGARIDGSDRRRRGQASTRSNVAVNVSPGGTRGAPPATSAFVGAAIGSSAANGRPAGTQTCAKS